MGRRPRSNIDILPASPGGSGSDGPSWRERAKTALTSATGITHRESAKAIQALRECTKTLSSQSGYHYNELMETAGLKALTKGNFEDGPNYPLLRSLLNIALFMQGMHNNYVQPNLMHNEERQLKEGNIEAAGLLLHHGKKWLETATLSVQDIKDQLDFCRQELGLAADAPWPADHPLIACLNAAQEAHRDLAKAVQPPQKALETLEKNLPTPTQGHSR